MKKALSAFFSFFLGIFGLAAVDKTIEGRTAKLETEVVSLQAEVSSLAALHTTTTTRSTTTTLVDFKLSSPKSAIKGDEAILLTAQDFVCDNGDMPSTYPLIWSSSHPSVASVDANGVVTGKNVGDCIITATADDAGGFSKSVSLIVTL